MHPMSRTRAMRALVAACVALAALAIGPAAQAQSTAPPPPPAAPDLEKPGALSARLTRVQEVHEARSRGERPPAADPLEVRGPGAIARRADGAPLVYVRVEPGAEPQVIEALSRRRGVDVVHEADGVRLCITQNDVRAIQLAKAALRAGIELLMHHAGLTELHDIRLAGAFGSHIDPVYALILGLVPDCPVAQVRSVGNAAGAGAVRALLSVEARREMEQAVRHVVKIETATEPAFQAEFIGAMAFPHATAPSPHLSSVVTLPERTASATPERGGRRRRARGEKEES